MFFAKFESASNVTPLLPHLVSVNRRSSLLLGFQSLPDMMPDGPLGTGCV